MSQPIFVSLSVDKLEELLSRSAAAGAYKALSAAGVTEKELLTRSELKRKFGAGNINSVIDGKKLTPHKQGKRTVYSVAEYMTLLN